MRLQPLITLLTVLLLISNLESFAQTIKINTRRAKETYEVNSTIVKQKEVKQQMASDQVSLRKFVGGQALNISGIAICASGSAVLLSGLGLAIENSVKNEVLSASEKVDESLSWTLIGVGVGALVPGAIMILQGRNERIKAVKNFNEKDGGSARAYPIQLKPASRGIGIALAF